MSDPSRSTAPPSHPPASGASLGPHAPPHQHANKNDRGAHKHQPKARPPSAAPTSSNPSTGPSPSPSSSTIDTQTTARDAQARQQQGRNNNRNNATNNRPSNARNTPQSSSSSSSSTTTSTATLSDPQTSHNSSNNSAPNSNNEDEKKKRDEENKKKREEEIRRKKELDKKKQDEVRRKQSEEKRAEEQRSKEQQQRAEREKQELLERQKAEAERARIEAEQRAEAEQQARAAETLKQQRAQAQQRFEEEKSAWDERNKMRDTNINVKNNRQPFEPSAKMDSSIKKCTGFLNKLKLLSTHSIDSLLKELETLNLSKYLSEFVSILVEMKFSRSVDLTKCISLCSVMYGRHPEFVSELLSGLHKVFEGQKAAKLKIHTTLTEMEEDKSLANRKRSTLRFLSELYLCGISDDLKSFVAILHDLISYETTHFAVKNKDEIPNSLVAIMAKHGNNTSIDIDSLYTITHVIISFLKYGNVPFCGRHSLRLKQLLQVAELNYPATPDYLKPQQKEHLLQLFTKYANMLKTRVWSIHDKLAALEKKIARLTLMRGDVGNEIQEERKAWRQEMEKLYSLTETVYDLLELELEPLPAIVDYEAEMMNIVSLESQLDAATESAIWDDEETRVFYESLPDLRVVVPPVLLQEGNEKEKAKLRREKMEKEKMEYSAEDDVDDGESSTANSASAALDDDVDFEKMSIDELERRYKMKSNRNDDDDDDDQEQERERLRNHPMDLLLASLATSFNREQVDAVAEKFCYLNTKANRARLVEAMYTLPRTAIDAIPYYCRLLATLNQYLPNMAIELVGLLQSEFYRLLKRKEVNRLESKIRNARFLGELCKFGVCPPSVLFRCWHACMLSFVSHSVNTCCTLLETCGRWLYRQPTTHLRTVAFLERMMKLKEVKLSEKHMIMLVDNAYFHCKPPQQTAILPKKVRTPIHQFIRKTLYQDLTPKTTEHILRRLRKLSWDDESKLLVTKCLANVSNAKYGCIGAMASVASGLNHYHQIGAALMDAVLEEIRVGLEQNRPSQNQRRILYVKYLGEFYAYRLFDSAQVIFDTLYLFITFGHYIGASGHMESLIDPPSDTFRIRLVCVLLETVGQYFDRGSTKRRLDAFLSYFQRYILLKELLPVDLDFQVADLFDKLRPKMQRARNLEDINQQIADYEKSCSREERLIALNENNAYDESDEEGDGDGDDDDGGQDAEEGRDPLTRRDVNTGEEEAEAADDESNLDEDEDPDDSDISEDEEDEDEEDEYQRSSNRVAPEDLEFQAEFDKMMADSLEQTKYVPRKDNLGSADSMAASVGLSGSASVNIRRSEDGDEEQVVFKFMARNTKKARELFIPLDSEIALMTLQNEQQQREEKEDMKRLLLKGLQREEREALAEERLKNTAWANQKDPNVDIDFKHRQYNPSERTAGGFTTNAMQGGLKEKKKTKDDNSLKLADFGQFNPELAWKKEQQQSKQPHANRR